MQYQASPIAVRNLIDGEFTDARNGAVVERRDPGDQRRTVAVAPDSDSHDAEDAIAAASAAHSAWAARPMQARLAVIEQALTTLEHEAQDIAVVTVLESGKTLIECQGEVLRAIATVRQQLVEAASLAQGELYEEAGVTARLEHVPVGVVAVITPWNFPFSALLRKVVPALAMGNTVVAKPSELSPVTGFTIASAFTSAGLPPGVLNMVHGAGGATGTALVEDSRVGAVSFTGSTRVGMGIAAAVGSRDLKVQLEMGGKNPLVVLGDADLSTAVDHAVTGGFTAAGQWCVATSRVILDHSIAAAFTDAYVQRVREIQVGHGLATGSTMGALVSETHFAKVSDAIANAHHHARVLAGGSVLTDADLAHGFFVAPTVVTDVAPASPLLTTEIFGPLVTLQHVDGIDAAIAAADDTPYGLAASVYTRNPHVAQQFLDGVVAGKVNVNLPPNFGDPRVPSSGRRASGRGESEGALSGLAFYTHERAVFIAL